MTTRRPLVLISGTPQELPAADALSETIITFTDVTTGNATASLHGFLPKLGGGTTNFLRADGSWATPPDTNTTYTASTGLTLTGTAFSANYGTTSTTACVGNDSRLSDARAPTAHTQAASTISDSTTAGRALLTAADVSAQRTTLGLVIGTNVQAYDADLTALADLTSAADRLPYFTGSGTASLATFTAAGRALLDDADAAAQRTTLELGTAATTNATAYATSAQGTLAGTALQPSVDIATAMVTATKTTEQLRLAYDIDNYVPFTVTSSGNLSAGVATTKFGINGIPAANINLYQRGSINGSTSAYAQYITATIQSDVTTAAYGIRTAIGTAEAAFTADKLYHFFCSQAALGAGSSVNAQHGFFVNHTLVGAALNYAFYANLPDAANNWNFYAAGAAQNYLAGNVGVGISVPTAKVHVISTTEQLRLGYDATKYASLTVDADGFMAVASGLAETPVVANTSTAYTITAKSLHDLTLTGTPVVFTFPTATAGRQFTLLLKQDATGTRLVTWPASVRWAGGTAPTLTTTAAKTDVISFIADGTYWLGFVGSLNFTRA